MGVSTYLSPRHKIIKKLQCNHLFANSNSTIFLTSAVY